MSAVMIAEYRDGRFGRSTKDGRYVRSVSE